MLDLVPLDFSIVDVLDWDEELIFVGVELASLFNDWLGDQARVSQQLSQIIHVAHLFIDCHLKAGLPILHLL